MPYTDPIKQNEAKQRSRAREITAGRCIRCPRKNDHPEINARLCSECRKKSSAEKRIARVTRAEELLEARLELASLRAQVLRKAAYSSTTVRSREILGTPPRPHLSTANKQR
jgi:hypothetical protein